LCVYGSTLGDQLIKITIYSNTTVTLTPYTEGDVRYPHYAIICLLEAPSRHYTITSMLETNLLYSFTIYEFIEYTLLEQYFFTHRSKSPLLN